MGKKTKISTGVEKDVELYSIPLWAKAIGGSIITETFNGHTYSLIDLGLTWHEAKIYCESMGGHLVTVTTQEEQDFIESLTHKGARETYWFGATDEDAEDTWKWVTGELWDYTNWYPGEPNNNGAAYYTQNYICLPKRWSLNWDDVGNGRDASTNQGYYHGTSLKGWGFICEFER